MAVSSQITATFPALNFPKEVDYPAKEDWAAWTVAAETNYAILSGSWSLAAQEFKAQANILSTEVNAFSNTAVEAKDTAVEAKNEAVSALAILSAGSINNTITGLNKTFSSSKIKELFDAYEDIGTVKLWYGVAANIKAGWAICDGENGTPNVTDRVVIGAGGTYALGDTGGSADAVVVSHTHTASADSQGSHAHSASTGSSGSHTHGYNRAEGYAGGLGTYAGNGNPNVATATHYVSTEGAHTHTVGITAAGAHGHNIAVSTKGESGTSKNLPPYAALYYIMKVA